MEAGRGWMCLLPVTADGQGFTKWFRKIFSVLVCVCTLPGTGGRSQTSPGELWSSVTWKIPLVPVQGQLLVPVAVTQRVAGPLTSPTLTAHE